LTSQVADDNPKNFGCKFFTGTTTLPEGAQYIPRAWWDADPDGAADVFYFDLETPPRRLGHLIYR
jgi:hypothetical protein